MKSNLVVRLLMLCSILFLSSCFSLQPRSLANIEAALIEANPKMIIDSSFTLSLGALTLDMLDFLVVHDKKLDVSKIKRVEVGVYELTKQILLEDFTLPTDFYSIENSSENRAKGCENLDVIMRLRDNKSLSLVLACMKKEELIGISLFQIEPSTITVVHTRGDYKAILQSLLNNQRLRTVG